jgi:hypothetical protein
MSDKDKDKDKLSEEDYLKRHLGDIDAGKQSVIQNSDIPFDTAIKQDNINC